MKSDDEVSAAVKLGVGVGVGAGLGYLIYRLLSGRGPGPGTGPGGGRGNDGGGVGEAPVRGASSTPRWMQDPDPAPPPSQPAPPRTHAARPIEARVRPSPTDPAKTAIEVEGQILSIGDLIARIDAGGRRDVIVAVRGDAHQGGWEEIRDALGFAGIQILLRQPAATTASGFRVSNPIEPNR